MDVGRHQFAEEMGGIKLFHVTCPICGGRLLIDDNARKVVEHVKKEDAELSSEEKMEDILKRLTRGKEEREKKLARAQELDATRRQRSEELFKKAQEQVKKKGETGPPPGPVWD